jgi:hypothetical protein
LDLLGAVAHLPIFLLAVLADDSGSILLEPLVEGDVRSGQRSVALLQDVVRLGQHGDAGHAQDERRCVQLADLDSGSGVDDRLVLLTILLRVVAMLESVCGSQIALGRLEDFLELES